MIQTRKKLLSENYSRYLNSSTPSAPSECVQRILKEEGIDQKYLSHKVDKNVYLLSKAPVDSEWFFFLQDSVLPDSISNQIKSKKRNNHLQKQEQIAKFLGIKLPICNKNINLVEVDGLTSGLFYFMWAVVFVILIYNLDFISKTLERGRYLNNQDFETYFKVSKDFVIFLYWMLTLVCIFLIVVFLFLVFQVSNQRIPYQYSIQLLSFLSILALSYLVLCMVLFLQIPTIGAALLYVSGFIFAGISGLSIMDIILTNF